MLNFNKVLATVLLLTSTSVYAGFQAGADSDYIFRGVSQTDGGVSAWAGYQHQFGDSGFMAGAWVGQVDFADGSDLETDLYAAWTNGDWLVGYIDYGYNGDADLDGSEFFINKEVIGVSVDYYLGQDDYTDYLELGHSFMGVDVSYGMYEQRKDGFFKSLMSKFNNMTATIILGKPYKLYLSPFKAFKADIKDEIIKYINPYPYIDGLILRVTNNINQVKISHFSRDIGGSGYNFIKSLSVWLNLFTSFSIIPLRVSSIIGFLTSLGSFILSIYFYISYLQGMDPPEGWQSTILIILFLGGIQLMTLGIIGEYLGRLYLSQSNLPQYSIKEILNDK